MMNILKFILHPCFVALGASLILGPKETFCVGMIVASSVIYFRD